MGQWRVENFDVPVPNEPEKRAFFLDETGVIKGLGQADIQDFASLSLGATIRPQWSAGLQLSRTSFRESQQSNLFHLLFVSHREEAFNFVIGAGVISTSLVNPSPVIAGGAQWSIRRAPGFF